MSGDEGQQFRQVAFQGAQCRQDPLLRAEVRVRLDRLAGDGLLEGLVEPGVVLAGWCVFGGEVQRLGFDLKVQPAVGVRLSLRHLG